MQVAMRPSPGFTSGQNVCMSCLQAPGTAPIGGGGGGGGGGGVSAHAASAMNPIMDAAQIAPSFE
jgi:hypothetical protein